MHNNNKTRETNKSKLPILNHLNIMSLINYGGKNKKRNDKRLEV